MADIDIGRLFHCIMILQVELFKAQASEDTLRQAFLAHLEKVDSTQFEKTIERYDEAYKKNYDRIIKTDYRLKEILEEFDVEDAFRDMIKGIDGIEPSK